MTVRWFRIPFARNAFLRSLDTDGLELEHLSLMHGVRAMESFASGFRPQHAELDALTCEWGPVGVEWEFAIVRRMQRHGHPESALRLVFGYTATAERTTSGVAEVSTWRDVRELEGYQPTRGSRPRYRRLEQA